MVRGPKGPYENSPAFQHRDSERNPMSPVGTVERVPQNRLQSSLRDATRIESEPGVETPGYCRLSLRDNLYALDGVSETHSANRRRRKNNRL